MKINPYQSTALLMQSTTKKAKEISKTDFSEIVKNVSVSKTSETKKLSKAEEMVEFKKEIYEELDKIMSKNSFRLSNSVQITEDGFEKMKEDPKYRKKIMDWLRADAVASHKLPYDVRAITTITASGATSYGVSDDLYYSDANTKQVFENHSKKAFYISKNTRREKEKFYIKRRNEQLRIEKKEMQKKLENELYLKKINDKRINSYIENSVLG